MRYMFQCGVFALVSGIVLTGCQTLRADPAATAPASSMPATAPDATAASQPSPAIAPTAPRVVELLDLLEKRDQTLVDFTAGVKYGVTHVRTDETETRIGTMSYAKVGGVTKIGVHFNSLDNDGVTFKLDEDVVYDGDTLIDRVNDKKQYREQHLRPPGAVAGPPKLGEGLIVLPIGQSREKILQEFAVTQEPTDPKDLPGVEHLKLVPRQKGAYNFKQLDLSVDTKDQLPVKMRFKGMDGNLTTISLSDANLNKGAAKIFSITPPPPESGWEVHNEPYGADSSKP